MSTTDESRIRLVPFDPAHHLPPAVAAELTMRERIEDLLLEHGVSVTDGLLDGIEAVADEEACVLAANEIRRLLLSLDGTSGGAALRRAVLGDGGESLREAARRCGITHRALSKQEATIRRRLARVSTAPC